MYLLSKRFWALGRNQFVCNWVSSEVFGILRFGNPSAFPNNTCSTVVYFVLPCLYFLRSSSYFLGRYVPFCRFLSMVQSHHCSNDSILKTIRFIQFGLILQCSYARRTFWNCISSYIVVYRKYETMTPFSYFKIVSFLLLGIGVCEANQPKAVTQRYPSIWGFHV